MKITNYYFFIKINFIFLALIAIQLLKYSSESTSQSTTSSKTSSNSNLNSKTQTSSKLKLTTNSKISSLSSNKALSNSSNKSFLRGRETLNKSSSQSALTTTDCNPLCSQCSSNDKNYCTLCQTGMIYYSYSCYISCPEGTFLNQEQRACQVCHNDCPICWGPEKDMCGSIYGSKTTVVSLEDEIIEYFNSHVFIKEEVDQWFRNLKILFRKDKEYDIYPLFEEKNPEFAVYIEEKYSAEIPIGSFSSLDGIFVPVPPYFNKDKKYIESHWVFRKGTWDGSEWHEEFYARLPSFIKYKGSTDKIYIENNGFWIYDLARNWIYMKSNTILSNFSSVTEKLSILNKIKFDIGNYNLNMVKLEMDNKRREIQNNVRGFFDKFSNMDVEVFSDLKKSIHENEANMMYHMETLKNNVSKYFNESPPEKDKMIVRKSYENKMRNSSFKVPKPTKLTKEQFDKLNESTGGLAGIQIEKQNAIHQLAMELNKIKTFE